MKVHEVLGLSKAKIKKEDIGFEIEVEGNNLPSGSQLRPHWLVTRDGSLNESGLEYVLAGPRNYLGFCEALNVLAAAYKTNRSRVNNSVRAGVHVHINIQNLSVLQLFNYITLSILLEDILVEYCGNSRIGNLFCMRSSDASYLIKVIQDVVETGNLHLLQTEDIRYAFVNMSSIFRHGSLEFRSMRSTTDFFVLKIWTKCLLKLKNYSTKFENPTELIEHLSSMSYEKALTEILGKLTKHINTRDFSLQYNKGIKNTKDFVYYSNWDKFNYKTNNNPFQKAKQNSTLIPNIMPRPSKIYNFPFSGGDPIAVQTVRIRRRPVATPAFEINMTTPIEQQVN